MNNLPQIQVPATVPVRMLRDQNYLMTAKERGVLITLLNELQAVTVIEIGVNEGRCAEIMLSAVPSIRRYVGVDVEPGYITSKGVQQSEIPEVPGKFALSHGYFELIVRPRGSLDLMPKDLPLCDAMLIDGDHGRDAVLHDTALAGARVRPGGLIIWHDYYLAEQLATPLYEPNPLDVTAVLNEFAHYGAAIQHIEDTWLAIMRVQS